MSTENAISVRQWLEKYHACLQGPKDFVAQFGNDWYDSFFSDSDEMCHRLSPFAKLAEAITDPYILDNYYIWFYEHDLPLSGKPYDDVRFDLLSGERNKQYFLVRLDCAGWKKWSLFSERYGFFAPEFDCGNVRSMAEYIDGMGLQDGLFCDRVVYRAGEHRYQYHSSNNPKLRTAIVVSASEKLPDGFPLEQAKEIRGILVWSPDGMERDEEPYAAAQEKQRPKKKEGAER